MATGVEFRVYKVADVSETGEMTLAGDFAGYPVSIWKNLTVPGGEHWRRR